jgi:signal transduction histidine kinase/DNA-binding response OmpR family regulator
VRKSLPLPTNRRGSVRAKLHSATIGIWITATLAMLGGVATAQYRAALKTAARTEARVLRSQQEKGHLLVTNQALALRGLALDNAFSDVRQLVTRTVQGDPDVIYGAFVDGQGRPWVVVTPHTIEVGATGAEAMKELAAIPEDHRSPDVGVTNMRTLSAFGAKVEEHVAHVFDGVDYLGAIRYGMNLSRTEAAVNREDAHARDSLVELLSVVALLGALGAGFGVIAIRRMATRITEPLAVLSRASEALAAGNRSARASVESGDELEQLAATFNAMAESNQRTMSELELKTAEALEVSRMKSEFLANMSHEIRTPMNGILGVVRLVRDLPLDGKLRRYIETVDASASALLTILDDVLDFSKMEAGKYGLNPVVCDLRTVVQEVCELQAARAYQKGLELVCRIDPKVHDSYVADPDRVRQVLNNLVGNAVKFTERGEVFVHLHVLERVEHGTSPDGGGGDLRSERVVVTVQDTGIGIASPDVRRLFDAFSQVDGSAVRRYGGTGLGLAISKRLVEMMNGEIGVRSVPGKGSEFYCIVPFEIGPAVEPAPLPWAEGKVVMVVEHHPLWQEAIREHLEAWGFEVLCSEDAEQALLPVGSGKNVDLLILGVPLRDRSVDEFIRHWRAEPQRGPTPIVALYRLGLGNPLDGLEGELAAQLAKPLRFPELHNTLRRIATGERRPSSKGAIFPAERSGRECRVLVVDDNDVNRYVAQEMLEQLGCEVDTASNGAEALERIRQGDFQFVFMDCQMPVMDGYAATQALRKLERGKVRRTTVIALTAHALVEEREKVLAVGMDDYLSKPVSPASLERVLRQHGRGKPSSSEVSIPEVCARPMEMLDAKVRRSRKLIELFLRSMPQQLDELGTALASGTASDVRALAHKAKGSCLAVGATAMVEAAERLQRVAEAGELASASAPYDVLRALARDTERELRRELAG